ncbi:potassium-transporting ATPase subunit C [Streptomyces sp. NBC_01136]|uniref:potassium-transporting ATPase subunit C n=1 Tax=unclassified Streptomyces TaxID=2593676 RepID=UPI00324EC398|nr:potassium-transporting ATPase subunit C [Streptomyces sp. NBC_01136]
MTRIPHWLAQHVAALRVVLVLTLLTGLAYPLAMTAFAQVPGLDGRSEVTAADGKDAGSSLIGQSFTDAKGNPLKRYFQSRPSNAGTGYDATASGAGNQGPESVVDTKDKPSLLTLVCGRSKAVGELEGVDGSRPFCTPDGVGAVLGVFYDGGTSGQVTRVVSLNQACPAKPFLATYKGVRVTCARPGADYSHAVTVPVRGDAPANPVVPADAVTASGSGLDPDISPAYARLQAPRVAHERGASVADVRKLIEKYTTGRTLGVLGEPGVNVVELNIALDRTYPSSPSNPKQGA